ncbi:non-ribosomal peptide synthetase [Pseudoxanthomonas sp. PXM02]|uniref:non-ribosomal peptide synthetase n=1 Tax=Pseudoxanthomonas sp. PXM02 TaxID=2769294 RepID=UPI00178320ED|nr:non-ribosomal peptide synthetase [Pseudoxanthomonas sp. PXM02]MBD9479901.1 amino acid adenylation domain-containing protein [Pseudoxanthomonas sp. PXM02]
MDVQADALARDVAGALPDGIRFPLTDAQAEKWLGSRYSDDATLAFGEAFELLLDGSLDVARFEQAVASVVARHQALAVAFSDDGTAQIHHPASAVRLQHEDLSSRTDPLEAYHQACARWRATPFDTATAPLVRGVLYRFGPDHHRLFMAAHHLVMDGWSMRVVLKDLMDHYNATTPDAIARIPAADSWREFVLAERARRDGPEGDRSLAYWRDRFATLPEPLRLPTDRPRAGRISFEAASFTIDMPAGRWQQLRDRARQTKTTRFVLLLTAYFALLHRLSGQTDLVCGIPFAGAARGSGARVVGDTDNTLPLRVEVDPQAPLTALATQVQARLDEAADHQDISLGRIVDALQVPRHAGRMLLLESVLTLVPSLERLRMDGVRCELNLLPRTAAAWELGLYWHQVTSGLVLEVQYQTALYDEDTIRDWAGLYLRLLEALADGSELPVRDLDLGASQSDAAFSLACEDTPRDGDASSLVALLERAFATHGPRTAAACGAHTIDYATLDQRSRQAAAGLRGRGVGQGDLVGIALPRSLDMLVAVIAVLRAGAAYVPLDLAFPPQRLLHMATHARLPTILTADGVALPAGLGDGRALLTLPELEAVDAHATLPDVHPDDLAYVLYTSGSTGEPKGVRILHRNLVNFLCSMREAPGCARDDVLCSATTLSFDIAALELYLPLICGAQVVIADDGEHRDPEALCRLIERHRCTMFQTTPSLMALLQEVGRTQVLAPLRLLVGGEALPLPLARTLHGQCRELWNMYGPTETTVWSSLHRIDGGENAVPLGQPIARTRFYLLDDRQRPALPHALGEIWIGGAGVADGYLHRPDLSGERFVPDPFAADGSRMYRTGDLGRLHAGQLHFNGRADEQIKLRGYRIEPGDIEAAAAGDPGVAECVAVVRALEGGDAVLVLYVGSATPPAVLAQRLRERLAEALPAYMRPQYIEVVQRLPKTPNGKIDRRALPPPTLDAPTDAHRRTPPRTAMERDLRELWIRLLQRQDIGIDDDFFALGGYSLLAVRMFNELHRRHGVDLPLATLIANPTIAALAQAIDAAAGGKAPATTASWQPLVRLRQGDGLAPLFLMHAVGGNVLNYLPLLESLDAGQPVFGLQAAGLDGVSVPSDSIDAMADVYADVIRDAHPHGPVLLAGGSMGGILALETARRLREERRDVALLAMFDTFGPERLRQRRKLRWSLSLAALVQVPWRELARRLRVRLWDVPIAMRRGKKDPDAALPQQVRLQQVERANHRALAAYHPQRYRGDVELFRTPVRSKGEDATLGWRDWIDGRINLHALAGNHHDFIDQPALAQRFAESVAAAQAARR